MGAAARGCPRGETCEVREPSEKGRTEWVRATAMGAMWLNEGVVRVWPSRERGWIRSGGVQGRVSGGSSYTMSLLIGAIPRGSAEQKSSSCTRGELGHSQGAGDGF